MAHRPPSRRLAEVRGVADERGDERDSGADEPLGALARPPPDLTSATLEPILVLI